MNISTVSLDEQFNSTFTEHMGQPGRWAMRQGTKMEEAGPSRLYLAKVKVTHVCGITLFRKWDQHRETKA